jgi:hypothetical protein
LGEKETVALFVGHGLLDCETPIVTVPPLGRFPLDWVSER